MKKTLLCLTTLAALSVAGQVSAATTTAPSAPTVATTTAPATTALSPQNTRMKDCAAQYHQKNLPKSQYKTFMSTCLKNPSTATATPAATTTSMSKSITPTATPAPAANAPSGVNPTMPAKP